MVFEGFEWTYTLYERIVYHNGEYFGCYLALEGVDKSFAKRNYGKDYGKLYKPELGKGDDRDKEPDTQDEDDGKGFGAIFGGNGFPPCRILTERRMAAAASPRSPGRETVKASAGKCPQTPCSIPRAASAPCRKSRWSPAVAKMCMWWHYY